MQVSPSIAHLAVTRTQYLRSNTCFDHIVVGACIFSRNQVQDDHSQRLLLVQRASTEHGFPDLWEIPGGSVEDSDPTIFHAVAREVFEETGLKLTRVVRAVGTGIQFMTGGTRKWNKLTFEIKILQNGNFA